MIKGLSQSSPNWAFLVIFDYNSFQHQPALAVVETDGNCNLEWPQLEKTVVPNPVFFLFFIFIFYWKWPDNASGNSWQFWRNQLSSVVLSNIFTQSKTWKCYFFGLCNFIVQKRLFQDLVCRYSASEHRSSIIHDHVYFTIKYGCHLHMCICQINVRIMGCLPFPFWSAFSCQFCVQTLFTGFMWELLKTPLIGILSCAAHLLFLLIPNYSLQIVHH